MSSTEDAAAMAKIRDFFEQRLVPAANALRERDVRFYAEGPDDAETWWSAGPASSTDFLEIEDGGFWDALRAQWEAEGLHELADLTEALKELALELEVSQEPTDEVSPFVYVMY